MNVAFNLSYHEVRWGWRYEVEIQIAFSHAFVVFAFFQRMLHSIGGADQTPCGKRHALTNASFLGPFGEDPPT